MSSAEPFSSARPAVVAGIADGWVRYGFNFEQPDGIKLLSDTLYARLQNHLSNSPPGAADVRSDDILVRHGLLAASGQTPTARSPAGALSLSVWLNIVDACNFGCFYCYIPELQKGVDASSLGLARFAMDDDTADIVAARLVGYCRDHGISRLLVKFGGGEPTLVIGRVERFCDTVSAIAGDIQVDFGILTNGTFEASQVLPVLAARRMSVSISIDGMEENHDRIRFERRNGVRQKSWMAIKSNVERLLDWGIKPYFLYTITRKNLADVPSFAAFSHAYGCGFRLSLERSDRVVDFAVQCEIADFLSGFYLDLARTAPLTLRFDRAARFSEWNIKQRKRSACTSCRNYVAVARDGGVASCQMRLDEPLGNLRAQPLGDVMARFSQHASYRTLRHPEEKTGGCTRCEFRFVCAGGCPQHTRAVWGDPDGPSPWCFVYGTLAPKYIEACAIHLARRLDASASRRSDERQAAA